MQYRVYTSIPCRPVLIEKASLGREYGGQLCSVRGWAQSYRVLYALF